MMIRTDIHLALRLPFVCLLLINMLLVWPAQAQLISPGELSRAHANLEGIANCSSCHQLGQVGINNDNCLSCHTPLSERLENNLGFHATVADQNCGDCHKDHFGADFDILRFEPETFDHEQTAYPLVGAHVEVSCRSCHKPEFIVSTSVIEFKEPNGALEHTWLGLTATCATCHASESVHGEQFFGQDCASCHVEEVWTDVALFDHDATDFPLTGRHLEASCDGCHKPFEDQPEIVHFENVNAVTCESCHQDTHEGALGDNCASCHITDDWDQFTATFPAETFDHSLTNFALTGKHQQVACASCHGTPPLQTDDIAITFLPGSLRATFPDPRSETCIDCHTDSFHDGDFSDTVGGIVCSNCHTDAGWIPTSYDLSRHNEETDFALTGAHLAAPCFSCHQNESLGQTGHEFQFESLACETCHLEENPHGTQFTTDANPSTCDTCHSPDTWQIDTSFDHAVATGFELTGRHLQTTCESCHQPTLLADGVEAQLFRGTDANCVACHQEENPHLDQFIGVSCNTCHDAVSFFIDAFDHSTTRFPLDGAHESVACGGCHFEEQTPAQQPFVRYKPLKMECQDCHDDLN